MKVIIGSKELGDITTNVSFGDHNDAAATAGAGAGAGAGAVTQSVELDNEVRIALANELRGYSITPTTLKARKYEHSFNDTTYEEAYSFGSGAVARFCINTYSTDLSPERVTRTEKKGGSLSKFSGKSGSTLIKAVKNIVHTTFEVDVLQKAVKHLLDKTDDTHAVLVDIIARNQDGLIVNEDTGRYEVHTVILYKNPPNNDGKHSIAVIDPSNVAFSAHLGNQDIIGQKSRDGTFEISPKLSHDKLLLKNGRPLIIILASAKDKIYQAPASAEVGPLPENFRDCIDIAVKLGLGFNTDAMAHKITNSRELYSNDVVQRVTNNIIIDTHLPEEDYGVLRSKQSSDIMIQRHLAKLIKALDEYVQCADVLVDDEDNELLTLHLATLRDIDNQGADALSDFCTDKVTEGNEMLAGLLETHSTEVVGEILSIGGEDHE